MDNLLTSCKNTALFHGQIFEFAKFRESGRLVSSSMVETHCLYDLQAETLVGKHSRYLSRNVWILVEKKLGMAKVTYEKELTALFVIDPYNDFISEERQKWDRLKRVAEANKCVPNMLQVLIAARKAKLRVFYALHYRYRPGDYETWKDIAPSRKQPGCERPSKTALGVARSAANSSLSQPISWPSSIGVLVGLRRQIWIRSSKHMAFISSSSSDS